LSTNHQAFVGIIPRSRRILGAPDDDLIWISARTADRRAAWRTRLHPRQIGGGALRRMASALHLTTIGRAARSVGTGMRRGVGGG